MVESAAFYSVPSCMARDTAHVALRDLGHQLLDRAARVREVERLDLAGPVVEVQPTFTSYTDAWRSALGQALAGGWARYTGNDNSHWSASWGNGC